MPQLSSSSIIPVTATAKEDAEQTIRDIHQAFGVTAPPLVATEAPIQSGVHQQNQLNYSYFHPDHLGSSSYITNGGGIVTQHMEYLPFGDTLVDEHLNSFNSPFKYNGKEFDEETGNYYYGARYYDPKWSIFVSVDPLAEKYAGVSSYAYCLNNPVLYIDPDGEKIVIANLNDQKMFLQYMKNIFGDGKFTFENNELKFIGNRKDLSGDQKSVLDDINKGISAKYNINIKFSNFTPEETALLEAKGYIATEGGAYNEITINSSTGAIEEANIYMDPAKLKDIPLYERVWIDEKGITYTKKPKDIHTEIVNRVIMENGKIKFVPKSGEATIVHEIAHPIYEGQSQTKVIDADNNVRRVLKIDKRSNTDPEHTH